jgi:hypothetical protein
VSLKARLNRLETQRGPSRVPVVLWPEQTKEQALEAAGLTAADQERVTWLRVEYDAPLPGEEA